MQGYPLVRDVMDTSFIKLRPQMNVYHAIEILLNKRITGAAVVDDDGSLVGIISERDCLKGNGNAMIIDPYGEILVESNHLGDDVVVGFCTGEKRQLSGGQRYIRARRPELYGKLVEPSPDGQTPVTQPGWELERPKDVS